MRSLTLPICTLLLVLSLSACAGTVPAAVLTNTPPPTVTTMPTATPAPTPTEMVVQSIPTPTGPYAVGYRAFPLTDAAREEIHTPDPADMRELTLHVWYPADSGADAEVVPYMAPAMAEAFGLSDAANRQLGYVVEGAPLAEVDAPVPVIIFNGGFNAFPEVYAALIAELTSQGYAVAVASHPYADQLALLNDGTLVQYPGDAAFIDALGTSDPYGAETYLVWIPDTVYAISMLSGLNDDEFGGQLDTETLGFMGHSFGGGVSAETCRILAARCAGAVNLDGSHPARLQSEGMPAPYLYIAAEATGSASSAEVRGVVENAEADSYLVEIAGATHTSFGDGYTLKSAAGVLDDPAQYGSIVPARMAEIVRTYTAAFFDTYMRGEDAPPLGDLAESDAEVTVEVWER